MLLRIPNDAPSLFRHNARAKASRGHNVRYVLGFAIAGVIVVFGIIWLFYFA
jgi:hypothetical protein